MRSGENNRGTWLWPAAVIGLTLVFFSPAIARTFYFRDAFNLFYPFKAVIGSHLRDLSIGLWNPYECLGTPFVGELGPGWFYPLNVVYLFLPPVEAFRAFIVVHYPLAALFMWLWLRSLGAGRAAAAAGALAYTLSGYTLTQSGVLDMLATCTWLPVSLWLLNNFLRRKSPSVFILFAATLALPFISGRAEGSMINGLAAAGWVLIAWPGGRGPLHRGLGVVLIMTAAALIAVVLAMIQFLPSYELGTQSMKGAGFAIEEATLWSFHPLRLIEFVLPSPWGRFWPEDRYCGWDLTGWEQYYPWALTEYMGLPVIAGAAVALVRAPLRSKLAVSAMLLAAVLLGMGGHTPFFAIARELFPPFKIFRFPEKYMLIAVFILASAGARGLDLIIAPGPPGGGKYWPKAAALAVAAAVPAMFAVNRLLRFFVPGECVNALGAVEDRMTEHYFSMQITHSIAVLAGLAGAAALARIPRGRPLAGPALVLLAFADLSLANSWVIPYTDPKIFRTEPIALAMIREHADQHHPGLFDREGRVRPGTFRVMREPRAPDERLLFGIEGKNRLEKYRRWERDTLLENFNMLFGLEHLTGYTVAVTADFNTVMRHRLNQKTMALFNVRYALVPGRGSWLEVEGLAPAAEDYLYDIRLFELPEALPRAYLVGRGLRVADPMERLDLIDTHDFRRAVVLEDHPRLPPEEDESDLEAVPAEIISYQEREVRVRTQSEVPAWLVLSDSYYPGWEAELGGEPVPMFRANYLVRAVRVPAGEHEVVFHFRPGYYRAGRAVSVLALLASAGVFVGEAVRRKRRPRFSTGPGQDLSVR